MIFRPPCAVCAAPAATVEVVAPLGLPVEWSSWPAARQAAFREYRKATFPYLLYSGPGGSNGWVGDPISGKRAFLILRAFMQPPSAAAIRESGFHDRAGFCESCLAFYCPTHWSISSTGFGTCPKGHGRSLDPHWSPDTEAG